MLDSNYIAKPFFFFFLSLLGLNSGLELARQALYGLNHAASTMAKFFYSTVKSQIQLN
jgi:hypothetical protein